MVEVTADLSGIKAFEEFRRDFPNEIKKVIRTVASDLRLKVKGETPFDSSTAKESWGRVFGNEGGFSFKSEIPYMHVLEYGLYPGVGKIQKGYTRERTVKTGTGIYSRQAIEGWIRKYTESDELLNDIAEKVIAKFKVKFGL
jgi:hypothetical protein